MNDRRKRKEQLKDKGNEEERKNELDPPRKIRLSINHFHRRKKTRSSRALSQIQLFQSLITIKRKKDCLPTRNSIQRGTKKEGRKSFEEKFIRKRNEIKTNTHTRTQKEEYKWNKTLAQLAWKSTIERFGTRTTSQLCFNVVPDEWVARCTRSPIHHAELEPNPCLRDKKTGRYFPPLPPSIRSELIHTRGGCLFVDETLASII